MNSHVLKNQLYIAADMKKDLQVMNFLKIVNQIFLKRYAGKW
jgi:hypothetical protein